MKYRSPPTISPAAWPARSRSYRENDRPGICAQTEQHFSRTALQRLPQLPSIWFRDIVARQALSAADTFHKPDPYRTARPVARALARHPAPVIDRNERWQEQESRAAASHPFVRLVQGNERRPCDQSRPLGRVSPANAHNQPPPQPRCAAAQAGVKPATWAPKSTNRRPNARPKTPRPTPPATITCTPPSAKSRV